MTNYRGKLVEDLAVLVRYDVISPSIYLAYALDIYDEEEKFLKEYKERKITRNRLDKIYKANLVECI